MIRNSLDWDREESKLLRQVKGLENTYDVKKMILNIRHDVTRLSIAEIDARRGKKTTAIMLLDTINNNIEMIEEYALIAKIMG
jgi:hypothetical protein